MDWMTFVAKLAEFLAWPVVALLIVKMLKPEIQSLLGVLRRLKAGPAEAEFERDVKALESAADQKLPPPPPPALESPKVGEERARLIKLAETEPRLAIIEAWREVELAARAALSARDISLSRAGSMSPVILSDALFANRLLQPEQFSMFNELRVLRNSATHAANFSPSLDAALSYIDVASRIKTTLEENSKPQSPPAMGGE
jgi:hypothetical protein